VTEQMLKITKTSKSFRIGGMLMGKQIMAVDNISMDLPSDKPWITSIVGESGSGKTTLARMILGLLEPTEGQILIDGKSIIDLRKKKLDFYRLVQPIFQNPFSAFSAHKTVDTYLMETAINLTNNKTKKQAEDTIYDALQAVGLDYGHIKGKYPNQFSGGELQRISIARALIPKPKLIIADEPVAMIDASLRMNIVNLFKKLRDERGINFVYVTHDLSTAYYVSDYIATMYKGMLIEFGGAKEILQNPSHPYTELLLDSIPRVGLKWEQDEMLTDMETAVANENSCRMVTRCKYAKDECWKGVPDFYEIEDNHKVLCYKFANEKK
jgi:oligopeptide/dipeptide ABC transporter, ATP-binding protein, C-terminal domain